MPFKFFEDKRPQNGLTFEEYIQITKEYISVTDSSKLSGTELSEYETKKLNLQRISRIIKTYEPHDELKAMLIKVIKPQLWMVLTEDWCGDSAQNLPYIYKISELSEKISFRLLERDKNLDIMDLYLTYGKSRSIPKLVAFDENGNEIFQWGPRPAEGQALVDKLKKEGFDKDYFLGQLHLWYSKNKGQSLTTEIMKLIEHSL